jgi:hypothetical protein
MESAQLGLAERAVRSEPIPLARDFHYQRPRRTDPLTPV